MQPPTESLTATIANLIRAGNRLEAAAEFAGADLDLVQRWMAKGAAGSPQFSDFHKAVKRAEAESELRDNNVIAQASENDWKAAAWRLEQRQQDRDLARLKDLTT